jgi:hypothetical protein
MTMPKQRILLPIVCFFSGLLWFSSCQKDLEPPVIRLIGPDSMTSALYGVFNDPGVIAFDANDLDLSDQVQRTTDLDNRKPGTYTLTYSVTDKAGNRSAVTRKVTVKFDASIANGQWLNTNNCFDCGNGGGSFQSQIQQVNISSGDIFRIRPALHGASNSELLIRLNLDGMLSLYDAIPCNMPVQTATGQINATADTMTIHLSRQRVTGGSYPCTITLVR